MSRCTWIAFCACLLCASIANSADSKMRTWVDVTGEHKLEASYVSHDEKNVTLKGRDGKTFEVELEQLSEADQKFVAAIAGTPAPKNKPRILGSSQERGELVELAPAEEGWAFHPKTDSALEFKPAEFKIPLEEFTESLTDFVITPSGRYGVITTSIPVNVTRVSIVDLSKKKVVASAATDGRYLGVAVSDDGQRVAIRSDEIRNSQEIGVFRVSGKTLKLETNFTPFPDRSDSDILWADFVGDNQLAVLCEDAGISIWNLSSFEEDCYFELDGDSAATRNFDGSVIAFADKQTVGLFHVGDRTFLGVQPVPEHLWTKHIAFSPSEQRLVSFGVNRIVVWDAATGAVSSDIPDLSLPGQKVDYVQENYLLLDDNFLVDLENQLKLWTYRGSHHSASAGGVSFFMIERSSGGKSALAVVPVSLPDSKARDALAKALADSDTFLLKPGGTVRLDVSKVPEPHREAVRTDLEARLKENRITVAKEATSTLVASISGPEAVSAKYYNREDRVPKSYSFTVLTSRVELVHDGKTIWSQQMNNQPPSLYVKEGESAQDQLTRLTKEPNLHFFKHAHLPKLIQKQTESDSPGKLLTIGESFVD